VRAGHDGTWVAHPGLVSVAREVFDEYMPGPNQIRQKRPDVMITAADLLAVPAGLITEQGLQRNIEVALRYMDSWLRGSGCVPIHHLMEDAATAEICRTQTWQWVNSQATLNDGRTVTPRLVQQMVAESMNTIRQSIGAERFDQSRYGTACGLLSPLMTSPELPEFLTSVAYQHID
jgi:malate synthase